MSDYILEVKSWATHFWGTVKGEHPKSCHGGSSYNAPESRGKYTCEQGHEIPAQIRWEVEAPWTEDRYKRYAAKSFDGPGPCQFDTEQEAIDAAAGRFTGVFPCQWWEEKVIPGQPGDKLYAGWIPRGPADQDLVETNWGTVIAEVPPRSEGECGLPGPCTEHGDYACDEVPAREVNEDDDTQDPAGRSDDGSDQPAEAGKTR